MITRKSHYDWLRENLQTFAEIVGTEMHTGLISAHGDKAYGYRDDWEKCGIPFPVGVAVYLLSYLSPHSKTVRETKDGWVDPRDWVIQFYRAHEHELKGLPE